MIGKRKGRKIYYKIFTMVLVLSMVLSSFTFNALATDTTKDFNAVKAAGIVTIDGVANEAGWQVSQELTEGITSSTNNTAKFGAMWDENNLYIAVDVKDANVINSGAQYPWDDDSVEVYIDGDNSKTYNSHTAQFIFRWNDGTAYNYGSSSSAVGIVHKAVQTANGYAVEAAIPWSCMGGMTAPAGGSAVGITVHVNDKDVNDPNTAVSDTLGYTANLANDWQDASNWAEMTLTGGQGEPANQTTPVTYDFRKLGGLQGVPDIQPGWSIDGVNITHTYDYQSYYGFHAENYDIDNRYATFNFDVLTTGDYGLKLKGFLAGGGAVVDVIVDDQIVGQYDFHGDGVFGELKLLSNMLLTKGTHKLTLKPVGRTGDSWGYCIYASEFALTMPVYTTLTYDFTRLGLGGGSTQDGWSIAEVDPSYGYYPNSYGLQFENYETYQDSGRHLTLNFDVPKSAPYELRFQGFVAGGGSVADILVDDQLIGRYDFHGEGAFGQVIPLTTAMLTQGTHKLTLRPVDRTGDSWGYCMYPSKFTLVEKLTIPELSTVVLDSDYSNLIVGQSAQLDVAGYMNDGKPAYLGSAATTYTSSDTSVATVDEKGNVTAVAGGTAIITAEVTLNNITRSGVKQITVINPDAVEVSITSDRTQLVVGQSAQLTLTGSYNGSPVSMDGADIAIESSDSTVASINGNNVINALKAGAVTVTANAAFGDVVRTAALQINIVDIALRDLVVTAVRPVIFTGQTTEIRLSGTLNNEDAADLSSATKVYSSSNEAVATVDGSGVVTSVVPGKATINVDVTLGSVTKNGSVEITVADPSSITSSKTRSTIYTTEKLAAARENVTKYNWAESAKNSAVAEADKYIDLGYDYLWGLVTSQALPRSCSTSLAKACPVCGQQMYAEYGLYGWQLDPVNNPWKLTCPKCKKVFPTNDFEAYYKGGLDENGTFDPVKAKAHNDKLIANGGKGNLVNVLYPEKGEKWGVDDGFGFVADNGDKFTFIAYYNHQGLWYDGQGGTGIISKALRNFRNAYIYTGDVKYARAGIILLDRIADVYPDFDLSAYKWDDGFVNSHGFTYQGKILGSIWEPMMVTDWIYAYDAFFPATDDQVVIDYLSTKALENNLVNPKISASAIRRNIEDNILRQVLPAIKTAQMDGNFGMHQSTLAAAAVVLDTMPETKEMLDFDFQAGARTYRDDGTWDGAWSWSGGDILRTLVDDVDRDGFGNEASPGYNSLWLDQLKKVADVLDGYDLYPQADLYNNVKFAKMYGAMYNLILSDWYSAQIGDTGGCGSTGLLVYLDNCVKAFEKFGDPIYAQLAYFLNGNSISGIHSDIFTADPLKVADDIKQVIDTYGQLDLGCTNITGYGFTALRDGENYLRDSGIPYSFPALTATENTKEFALYASSGTIQFQNTTGAGERITFAFDVPAADTYEVDLQPFKATSYGIYDIKIDGQVIKQSYDFYGNSGAASAIEMVANGIQLTAGTHYITFECTGKEDVSENYKMGVRKLLLLNAEAQKMRDNAVLKGDTQRDVWLYYGRNTGHGHNDTLNLGMHAYGLDIAPENGYPEQTGPYPSRMAWTENTSSHNTVVVDEQKQKDEYSGIPYHFDDSDMVKLIDVEAPGVYTQTDMYRRTTAMIKVDDTNSYTVDFFRVKGGDDHHFSFHGYAGPVTTEGLNLVAQPTGTYAGPDVKYAQNYDGDTGTWGYMGSGFQYLYNVQKDTAPKDMFSVDWDIDDSKHILPADEDVHLRLTMLTQVDDVAICDGNPPASPGNPLSLKYMIAHRTGTDLDSLFASVLEPYKANRYIESISPVTVKANGVVVENDVKAMKIVLKNGRTDYIVNALDNTTLYTIDDKIQFKGFFGVYSEKDGNPVYTYVNDGTVIGNLTASKASITGTVVDFTKEMSKTNEITVKLDDQNTLPDLTGKYIYVENDKVRNASYKIKGARIQDDGKIVLDIGDITTIRQWADPNDFSKGYIYDMAEGARFSIPLTYESTISLSEASLSADKSDIELGETANLTMAGKLSDGTDADLANAAIEYVSSDPAVAAVSSDGVVAAINVGSVDIYANVTLNGVTVQSSTITVKVSVSVQSIRNRITQYIASGDLKGDLVVQLTNSLKQAEFQYDKGSVTMAVIHMNNFIKHLNNPDMQVNVTEAARAALEANAKALIKLWSEK